MAFADSKAMGLGFSLIATALLIMYLLGFSIPFWSTTTNAVSFNEPRFAYFGLWRACGMNHDMVLDEYLSDKDCFSTLEQGVPGWLRAVQLFTVLVVVFGLASWVMLWWVTCSTFGEDKAFKVMLPCWLLTGICMLVAMCIFGHYVKPRIDKWNIPGRVEIDEQKIEYAWGFIIVAITTALWNSISVVFVCITCCC